MCIRDREEAVINYHDPLLLLSPGYKNELQETTESKSITIISNNYLKNIRTELLEENETSLDSQNNEILYITAEAVSYTHLDVYKRQGFWYSVGLRLHF